MSGRAQKVRCRDGEELCPPSERITQVFRPPRKRTTQVSGIRPRPAAFTVARAERGDTAALTELFRQHQAGLHAYFTGPAHWYWHFVPDLVQETMTRAVEALPRFRGKTDAEAERWLFGIARNVHLQGVRRQMGIRLRQDVAQELARQLPHACETPWMMCDLFRGLEQLPLSQLEVLRLMLAGLTIREIAVRMDIPEGTVATRIHRARRRLRLHIELNVPDVP